MHCEVFQKDKIEPISKRLAHALWVTLQPQLVAFGSTEATLDGSTDRNDPHACLERLEEMFFSLLLLKGKLECAAEYYSFRWLLPGEDVDRNTTDDVWNRTGPSEVLYCLLPMVQARNTKEAELRFVAKATVLGAAKAAA